MKWCGANSLLQINGDLKIGSPDTNNNGENENKEILSNRVKINKMASCKEHYQLPSITKKESLDISNLIFQKL